MDGDICGHRTIPSQSSSTSGDSQVGSQVIIHGLPSSSFHGEGSSGTILAFVPGLDRYRIEGAGGRIFFLTADRFSLVSTPSLLESVPEPSDEDTLPRLLSSATAPSTPELVEVATGAWWLDDSDSVDQEHETFLKEPSGCAHRKSPTKDGIDDIEIRDDDFGRASKLDEVLGASRRNLFASMVQSMRSIMLHGADSAVKNRKSNKKFTFYRFRIDREDLLGDMMRASCSVTVDHLFRTPIIQVGQHEKQQTKRSGEADDATTESVQRAGASSLRSPSSDDCSSSRSSRSSCSRKWLGEGGGVGAGVSDQGGVTAECFALAFEQIRDQYYETDGAASLGPTSSSSRVSTGGGGADGWRSCRRALGLKLDSDLFLAERTTHVTTELKGVGSVMLWALLQGQNIPADLLPCHLFAQLLGVDVIRTDASFEFLVDPPRSTSPPPSRSRGRCRGHNTHSGAGGGGVSERGGGVGWKRRHRRHQGAHGIEIECEHTTKKKKEQDEAPRVSSGDPSPSSFSSSSSTSSSSSYCAIASAKRDLSEGSEEGGDDEDGESSANCARTKGPPPPQSHQHRRRRRRRALALAPPLHRLAYDELLGEAERAGYAWVASAVEGGAKEGLSLRHVMAALAEEGEGVDTRGGDDADGEGEEKEEDGDDGEDGETDEPFLLFSDRPLNLNDGEHHCVESSVESSVESAVRCVLGWLMLDRRRSAAAAVAKGLLRDDSFDHAQGIAHELLGGRLCEGSGSSSGSVCSRGAQALVTTPPRSHRHLLVGGGGAGGVAGGGGAGAVAGGGVAGGAGGGGGGGGGAGGGNPSSPPSSSSCAPACWHPEAFRAMLAHSLLFALSEGERRQLVCGKGPVTAREFLEHLQPHFTLTSDSEHSALPPPSSSSSSSSSSSVLAPSPPPRPPRRMRAPAAQVRNLKLLCRVVKSREFQPYLPNLLRFITGCPSLQTTGAGVASLASAAYATLSASPDQASFAGAEAMMGRVHNTRRRRRGNSSSSSSSSSSSWGEDFPHSSSSSSPQFHESASSGIDHEEVEIEEEEAEEVATGGAQHSQPTVSSPRIHVHFSEMMPSCYLPESHTCFQALYLSAAPYESEEQLSAHLRLCAQHCTTFGKK